MPEQAEATHQHLALPVRQVAEPGRDALANEFSLQRLGGIATRVVGDGVYQRGIAVGTERHIHRSDALVQTHQARHLLRRFVDAPRDLSAARLVIQVLGQFPLRAQAAVEVFNHVNRQADRARLIHNRALNGLANPPGGVGGEAKTALGVELLHGAHQPQVTLFDQIGKTHAAGFIAARYVHHQAQIAFDHTLARRLIAALSQARVVFFFIRREQRDKADFVEVALDGIETGRLVAGRAAYDGCIRQRWPTRPSRLGRASSAGLDAAVLTRVNLGTNHGLSPVFYRIRQGRAATTCTEANARPISLTGGYPQHKSAHCAIGCAGAVRSAGRGGGRGGESQNAA